MNETPAWIQAITSVLTFFAAVAAGLYARRAAMYTKQQATASDNQVHIAKDALEITRGQARAAEKHGEHQVNIALESLEIAQQEVLAAQATADRQAEEAQATYRRYEESKLDAAIPVVLATVRRSGWFVETQEMWEPGKWTGWEPLTRPMHFDDTQEYSVRFRISLIVTLENVSPQIARIDVIDAANGNFEIPPGQPVIVPPHQERKFKWTRHFTPVMLATDDEINDPKNWLFDPTLWVRDIGMNVRDTYKFNSDLRLFSRDGSRLAVLPVPVHTWTDDFAQPLQQRFYERLEGNRTMTVGLNGSGRLTTKA